MLLWLLWLILVRPARSDSVLLRGALQPMSAIRHLPKKYEVVPVCIFRAKKRTRWATVEKWYIHDTAA